MQDKLSGGGWAQISTLRSSQKTKTKCERRDEIPYFYQLSKLANMAAVFNLKLSQDGAINSDWKSGFTPPMDVKAGEDVIGLFRPGFVSII